MRIHNKIILRIKDGLELSEEGFEYAGPVAECKGGSSSTTTTQPWSGQEPYLTDVMQQAQSLEGTPLQQYSGETVAGFTPEQTLAQDLTTQRALTGNPLLGQAQQLTSDTLQGKYLDPNSNPWLEKSFQSAAGDVTNKFLQTTMPEIKKAAIGAGAYGGSRQGVAEGIASTGLQDELGKVATGIYSPAYTQERSLMGQAATQAPALAEADYTDISKLAGVGEEKQGMQQSLDDAAKQAYQFTQTEPWNRLGMYSNLVSGGQGGTTAGTYSGK